MTRPAYRELVCLVQARQNCVENNPVWFEKHTARIKDLVDEHLPSGSGFDSGTVIDLDRSTGNILVFQTSFHHMDEGGGYNDCTEHTVTVRPSLAHGFLLSVGGRNRNGIKSYIGEMFENSLNEEVEIS